MSYPGQEVIEKRQSRKHQLEKEEGKKKIRSKAERNRAKTRENYKQFDEYNEEERLLKKLKKGKIDKQSYQDAVQKIDRKYEYKTTD